MRRVLIALVPLWLVVSAHAAETPTALPVEVEALEPAPAVKRDLPSIRYPTGIAKLGRTSDCRMRVSIDKKGRPTAAEVVECDKAFSRSAGIGLRQWLWESWRVDGKKAPHSFDVMVRYRVDPPGDDADPATPAEAPGEAEGAGQGVASDGEVGIIGSLERDAIRAGVAAEQDGITYCYQRRYAEDPALSGKVVIKFVIAKDGSVSSAGVKSSTVPDPEVEQCVRGRFLRMQFPEPEGGGIVIVTYPVTFSPGDQAEDENEDENEDEDAP